MRKTKMKKNAKLKIKDNKSKKSNKSKKRSSTSKTIICPQHFKKLKLKNKIICVGRCPHSGGEIFYDPQLDKLKCNLHGALFKKDGSYISGPPMGAPVKVLNT